MQNTSYDLLSASEKAFVNEVCASLNANRDPAQIAVYGDGSASPNGERFAAKRESGWLSWEVVFNFPASGRAYATDVQLPIDWHLEMAA